MSTTIRLLKDIPLEITTVQGTSAVFRYSELFPTLPNIHSSVKKTLSNKDTALVFQTDSEIKLVPLYIPPIEGKFLWRFNWRNHFVGQTENKSSPSPENLLNWSLNKPNWTLVSQKLVVPSALNVEHKKNCLKKVIFCWDLSSVADLSIVFF